MANDYLQPKGLHFSEDSIRLSEVAPLSLLGGRAADLGCGCGAVGLEALAKGRLAGLKDFYFVEKLWAYQPYLAKNLVNAEKRAAPGFTPPS
jgi:16S rRNA G966 N2-methylase RsmD